MRLVISFFGSKPPKLHGLRDSNWAGDLRDRKSTSAFQFKMVGGALS